MSTSATPPAPGRVHRIILGVFAVLLAFNVWGVSVGWKNLNLPGCEFRQAQTALSALFIQRDHDFSLAYPTPVLGKPWSVPMEFPLYQWTVVVLSNATGMSLTSAGRTVSAACFYLALPAFYLLLARLGLNRTQRLVGLGFILTCPLYVFYARAFLIETMALMFGAWYLVALIAGVEKRSWRWIAFCVLAGTAVGLIKVTTFILFLIPAFVASIRWLWQSRPAATAKRDWEPLLRTFGWLAAAHAIPFLVTYWWVGFSDAVKMRNPSGEALTSFNLAGWNFGIGQRFSPVLWAAHWRIFFHDLLSPLAAVLGLVALFFVGRRWLMLSLLSLALFMVVQLVFPVLYAWHDYYYVANGFALMGAVALIMVGLLDSAKIPRTGALAVLLVAYVGQASLWYRTHYPDQKFHGIGGNSVHGLIRTITDPDEAIVVVGDDWNSMMPYYAQRRMLMLRDDMIRSPAKLDAALRLMKDTPVAMMILRDDWRGNRAIVQKVAPPLGIDPRPALTWAGGEIYLHADIRTEVLNKLEALGMNRFGDFALTPESKIRDRPLANKVVDYSSLPDRHKKLFRTMRPAPQSFFSSVGPELWDEAGEQRYFAHPETKLWFVLNPGTYRLRTTIMMTTSSYSGIPPGEATDGVTLIATAVDSDGGRQEIRRQHVNPRDNPADRGVLQIDWVLPVPKGRLELAVTPGPSGSSARDWATLGAITLDVENAK
ncbi:MAG: glycosyltransferase family 39 protein [Opitutaceae bacterium]